MKIYTLPVKEVNPDLLYLKNFRKAKDYTFAAMRLLGWGFRDIADLCGYRTDHEFDVFIRKFTKGHRLKITSPFFTESKRRIDHEIEKNYKSTNSKPISEEHKCEI